MKKLIILSLSFIFLILVVPSTTFAQTASINPYCGRTADGHPVQGLRASWSVPGRNCEVYIDANSSRYYIVGNNPSCSGSWSSKNGILHGAERIYAGGIYKIVARNTVTAQIITAETRERLDCSTNPSTYRGAESIDTVFGVIRAPSFVRGIGEGSEGVSNFINWVIRLIFILAGILFLFMLLIGAFQILTSGGDKEAVGNGRKRITYAIIGIVVLAMAFMLARIIGQITGFQFFVGQPI